MAETKYGKYILTELRGKVIPPWSIESKPEEKIPLLYMDSRIIEGAFYVEASWFLPPRANKEEDDVKPHIHDFNEVLAVFGTDLENPQDLCGELVIWLGDEKHIITKSCMVFIPEGLKHGPIKWNRIDRPIFHFAVGTAKEYYNPEIE